MYPKIILTPVPVPAGPPPQPERTIPRVGQAIACVATLVAVTLYLPYPLGFFASIGLVGMAMAGNVLLTRLKIAAARSPQGPIEQPVLRVRN